MITVSTRLQVDDDNARKSVLMEMSIDDSLSLSTILLNLPDMGLSDDWKKALRVLSTELLAAANRAR